MIETYLTFNCSVWILHDDETNEKKEKKKGLGSKDCMGSLGGILLLDTFYK